MTNNPTIDGVSRELLEQALRRAAVFDDGSDGADAESAQSVVGILRALLDAPAVERQELHDPLSNGFYTTQSGGGNYSINIGFRTLVEMQSADKQMLNVLRNRSEVAALQSTIAQLQAQAADLTLEIEQGESIELLREISEYLDGSKLNSVCSDSILHRKIKACLDATAALNRRDTPTFELADADGYEP